MGHGEGELSKFIFGWYSQGQYPFYLRLSSRVSTQQRRFELFQLIIGRWRRRSGGACSYNYCLAVSQCRLVLSIGSWHNAQTDSTLSDRKSCTHMIPLVLVIRDGPESSRTTKSTRRPPYSIRSLFFRDLCVGFCIIIIEGIDSLVFPVSLKGFVGSLSDGATLCSSLDEASAGVYIAIWFLVEGCVRPQKSNM